MLTYNKFYLTLIRHAESLTNTNPDILGQTDNVSLSLRGFKQAELLGKRLTKEAGIIDYVYSSPYLRAKDTANISLMEVSHPPLQLVYDLREYSAGDWTGESRKIITPEIKMRMGNMMNGFLPPNGESIHQVERRASKWLEDNILYNENIIKDACALRDRNESPLNIYCFSHGMTIKALLHYIMGFDQSFTWYIDLENTSITKLFFGENGWRLLGINDHSHLFSLKENNGLQRTQA